MMMSVCDYVCVFVYGSGQGCGLLAEPHPPLARATCAASQRESKIKKTTPPSSQKKSKKGARAGAGPRCRSQRLGPGQATWRHGRPPADSRPKHRSSALGLSLARGGWASQEWRPLALVARCAVASVPLRHRAAPPSRSSSQTSCTSSSLDGFARRLRSSTSPPAGHLRRRERDPAAPRAGAVRASLSLCLPPSLPLSSPRPRSLPPLPSRNGSSSIAILLLSSQSQPPVQEVAACFYPTNSARLPCQRRQGHVQPLPGPPKYRLADQDTDNPGVFLPHPHIDCSHPSLGCSAARPSALLDPGPLRDPHSSTSSPTVKSSSALPLSSSSASPSLCLPSSLSLSRSPTLSLSRLLVSLCLSSHLSL